MTPLVSIEKATLFQSDFPVVRDVSLRVDPQTLWRIEGPNGAGKTTLVEAIVGLVPVEGACNVAGHPPGSRAAREILSFAPAEPALFYDKTVDEHVTFVESLYRALGRDAAIPPRELSERLGVRSYGECFPGELSTGDRKKVALILAMIRPFELMLLDEPFVHLDSGSREVLEGLIRSMVGHFKKTICFVSHGSELQDDITGRIRLEAGRLSVQRILP